MPRLKNHIRLEILDQEYQRLSDTHYTNAPKGMPVGGGDWMDSFFRMEAIRGTMNGLRRGLSLEESID